MRYTHISVSIVMLTLVFASCYSAQSWDDELAPLRDMYSHLAQGDYEAAELAGKKALEDAERRSDQDPDSHFTVLHGLAAFYGGMDRFKEAEQYYEKAIQFAIENWGNSSSELEGSLSELGNLYVRQKKFDAAEIILKRALELAEKNCDSVDCRFIIGPLNDLGALHLARGELVQAEEFLERAYKLLVQYEGEVEDPIILENMGELRKKQKRFEEAEQHFRQALVYNEEVLGSKHHYVVATLEKLSELYQEMNEMEKARQLEERAAKIRAMW